MFQKGSPDTPPDPPGEKALNIRLEQMQEQIQNMQVCDALSVVAMFYLIFINNLIFVNNLEIFLFYFYFFVL